MTTRAHKDNLVDELSAYFPLKRSSSTAWGNIHSLYMLLPGLRGFWPTSVVGGAGELNDVSSNGLHLTNNGSAIFNLRGPRSFITNGTGDWFSRADEAAFQIGQDEAYISVLSRGLAIGCWFRLSTLTTTQRMIIGKWNPGSNQRSYALKYDTDERVVFQISDDGTNVYQIKDARVLSTSSGRWVFVAGVWDDLNASISVYVSNGNDLNQTTNSTSIPGTIFNSTADFTIGAEHGGNNPAQGNTTLAFLCCQALEYGTLDTLFNLSRSFLLRYPNSNF